MTRHDGRGIVKSTPPSVLGHRMAHLAPMVVFGILLSGTATAAQDLKDLRLPIDCKIQKNCWVVQYFDHDPGPAGKDYACGRRTYDGHTGTDIGLRDLKAMGKGVAVLAAAPGTVRAVRDGVADRTYTKKDATSIKGRGCGNGVVVSHGNGWATQYCHLRKGSIRVRRGQSVTLGQTLGLVGLSGRTQFPHLEFLVRNNGRAIDPFTGPGPHKICGLGAGELWHAETKKLLAYSPADIYLAGISGRVPSPEFARAGRLDARVLPASAKVIVAWADIYAVRAGDEIDFRLFGPDGGVLAKTHHRAKKTRIRYFRYVGKKRRAAAWPRGTYRAEFRLKRRGQGVPLIRKAERRIEVR